MAIFLPLPCCIFPDVAEICIEVVASSLDKFLEDLDFVLCWLVNAYADTPLSAFNRLFFSDCHSFFLAAAASEVAALAAASAAA